MKTFLSFLGVTGLLLVFLGLAPLSYLALQDQSVPDWENPSVVGINKEPPDATAFPFESRALARDE